MSKWRRQESNSASGTAQQVLGGDGGRRGGGGGVDGGEEGLQSNRGKMRLAEGGDNLLLVTKTAPRVDALRPARMRLSLFQLA